MMISNGRTCWVRTRNEEEALHIWTEMHDIQKGRKLLKEQKYPLELTVWDQILIQQHSDRILNFDIPKDIKKSVKPQPEINMFTGSCGRKGWRNSHSAG